MVINRDYFRQNAQSRRVTGRVDLPRDLAPGPRGSLRRGQLGAIFAAGAHFSTSREPAILSLPSGAGKSGVMTALPFILSSGRVLVVTPSKLLRGQAASEFSSLTVLRRTDVANADLISPR